MKNEKVELLLPAGDEDCLRAAVHNGADAVYLGLSKFNARINANNFSKENLKSVIEFCHKRNVKVYITFNTLIKNDELKEYFDDINFINLAGADAVIIQDICLAKYIKKEFPKLKVHLSTQATVTNSSSSSKDIDRVILARELDEYQIKQISKKHETEIFVHGALCFAYSGQCIFSSLAGGRSGNRGCCAQPCRQKYNNKYPLSTMDLCMIEKIPDLIKAGVKSFKIEGRMRSAMYVAQATKAYRKAIDSYYNNSFKVPDLSDLKLAFNREFTSGFAYNNSIVDSRKPMNRGLFLGKLKNGKLKLNYDLLVGDGIGIWLKDDVIGYKLKNIHVDKKSVEHAKKGDTVKIATRKSPDNSPVYKTSSVNVSFQLGEKIIHDTKLNNIKNKQYDFLKFKRKENEDKIKLFVKVSTKKQALLADSKKADVIYYDIFKDDILEVKNSLKNSKFFVFTPRILSDDDIKIVVSKINELNPDGVLVGNRGLLPFLKSYECHLDYSFNSFNDIDLNSYNAIPIISPELNFDETTSLFNKNFIVPIHGDLVLMTTKEKLKYPELVDDKERRFKTRKVYNGFEVLNEKQLGLFNKSRLYLDYGIKYFFMDINKDADKFVNIYKKILSKEKFDDSRIKRGYTIGHFSRGV